MELGIDAPSVEILKKKGWLLKFLSLGPKFHVTFKRTARVGQPTFAPFAAPYKRVKGGGGIGIGAYGAGGQPPDSSKYLKIQARNKNSAEVN